MKRMDLRPSLWIGIFFYILLGRSGLDFLITGNNHLGPIEFGSETAQGGFVQATVRPRGADAYVAAVVYMLFFSVTLGVIIYTGFWRQWLFWKVVPARTAVEAMLAALFAFVALTEIFAAPTTLLLAHHNLVTTQPVGPLTQLYAKTEEQYVWQFVNGIPALDIPNTFNWKIPYEFKDVGGGSLVLLYKILVIVPTVSLTVDLMKRTRQPRSTEATAVRNPADDAELGLRQKQISDVGEAASSPNEIQQSVQRDSNSRPSDP